MRRLSEVNRASWRERRDKGRYRLEGRYRIALERLVRAHPSAWLDIGTGNGFLPEAVSPHLPGARIVGVDFVPEVLRNSEAPGFRVASDIDRTDLPFRDGSFEAVTLLEVLEHLVFPADALREIRRVLAPSGILLVSVPNLQFVEYVAAFAKGKVPGPAADVRHMSVFTLGHLRRTLERAGFRVTFAAGCDASPAWLARVSRRYLCKTLLAEGRVSRDAGGEGGSRDRRRIASSRDLPPAG